MTSTPLAPSESATGRRTPVLLRIGVILGALLALVDLFGTISYWSYSPVAINVAYLVIIVLSLLGAVFAWRGAAWGIWTLSITRFLSIVLSLPEFLDPSSPAEAIAPSAIQDVVTVVAIVLLLVGLARRRH
jgi:hypothetical protein